MPNLFEKIKKSHLQLDPIEYIYVSNIIDIKEYDKLYELQKYFTGDYWNNFKKKYKIDCNFFDDINDIDKKLDVICLWFFKDRGDRHKGDDIEIGTTNKKIIVYKPNTFFIIKQSNIKILQRKKTYQQISRPCLQIKMTVNTYDNLKEGLQW